MTMGGVLLLRRAVFCTRRLLRLSPSAPLLATAAAVKRPFCSSVIETKTGGEEVRFVPGGEEAPDRYRDKRFKPGWGNAMNHYLGEIFIPGDLQQLIEQHFKGDAQVLPVITEEIVFRRLVRLSKRSIASTNNRAGIGYYFAVGSGVSVVIPSEKVEDEDLLHPQIKRIIHYLKFIEAQSTKEVASEEGEDPTKWKDILREVRPSCYHLLSSSLKRTLVYVCVELGDMCERGEIKGKDAYDLLMNIVKDMDENREDKWDRYITSYII